LTYSALVGLVKAKTTERILCLLETLGFPLYHDLLNEISANGNRVILEGLEEFREHLGGELTITLIQGIGEGIEVHAMDRKIILDAVRDLNNRHISLRNA
jgi:3-dehydroquinate synthase